MRRRISNVHNKRFEPKIAFCKQQYAARGLSCGFRLSVLQGHAEIEEVLTKRGYMINSPNLVVGRDSTVAPEADITVLALDDWLETVYRVNPVDDPYMLDWERRV